MTKSWKSTLGGALSALGTSLMGIGIVPQLSGEPNKTQSAVALAGFICCACGQFFGLLFAADKSEVQAALNAQSDSIAQIKGDTSQLKLESKAKSSNVGGV